MAGSQLASIKSPSLSWDPAVPDDPLLALSQRYGPGLSQGQVHDKAAIALLGGPGHHVALAGSGGEQEEEVGMYLRKAEAW